jgi:hypothetical protein
MRISKAQARERAARICDEFLAVIDRVVESPNPVLEAIADRFDHLRYEAVLGDDGHQVVNSFHSLVELDVIDGMREALGRLRGVDMRTDDQIISWREVGDGRPRKGRAA